MPIFQSPGLGPILPTATHFAFLNMVIVGRTVNIVIMCSKATNHSLRIKYIDVLSGVQFYRALVYPRLKLTLVD